MASTDWTSLIATDPSGEALGRVEDVFVDPGSGDPRFALVRTARFGGLRHRTVLVPAHRAHEREGTLELPYDADRVRQAPDAGEDARELAPEREREVLAFFGEGAEGDATPQGTGGTSVLLSEERLDVTWRVRDVERVRLRKVIVEEDVTVTVRVRREELLVEHEPIPDPDGDAEPAPRDLTPLPDDMVLYAEEPVVTTRVVPRERVRLSRRIVRDQVVLRETVRHEEARVETIPGRGERLADERVPPPGGQPTDA